MKEENLREQKITTIDQFIKSCKTEGDLKLASKICLKLNRTKPLAGIYEKLSKYKRSIYTLESIELLKKTEKIYNEMGDIEKAKDMKDKIAEEIAIKILSLRHACPSGCYGSEDESPASYEESLDLKIGAEDREKIRENAERYEKKHLFIVAAYAWKKLNEHECVAKNYEKARKFEDAAEHFEYAEKWGNAAENYERAAKNEDWTTPLEKAAILYEKSGNLEKAIEMYEAAASIYEKGSGNLNEAIKMHKAIHMLNEKSKKRRMEIKNNN